MEQQIAYCTTSDGVRIAYATYGNDGAPPLVYLPELPQQEATWAAPWGRAFFQALARYRRLVTLDGRGGGASQRGVDCSLPVSADLTAVADCLGLDTFELFAGGPLSSVTAVISANASPGRVSKLVMFTPAVASSSSIIAAAASVRASLPIFLRSLATFLFPSGPPEVQRWLSTAIRDESSAEALVDNVTWTYDLAPILPQLGMPVLILHRKRSQFRDTTDVRAVASLIPGSRLVVLDGDAAAPYWDYEQFIDILHDFLGIEASARAPTAPSGTAVVLFTDIADSTALTERMGDAAFRAKARSLDTSLRAIITQGGGTTIDAKTLGDGVLATFSAASQAIDAALRCSAAGDAQGLPLHIGLHAGDVIRESDNVYGGAVNIASRVCGLSAPGEVLVSGTVRELARTSAGVEFEDRGEQEMKGVGEPVRVYAVRGS
jgi:class 3 adenylate cyclase